MALVGSALSMIATGGSAVCIEPPSYDPPPAAVRLLSDRFQPKYKLEVTLLPIELSAEFDRVMHGAVLSSFKRKYDL